MNPTNPFQPRRQFLWEMGAGFAGLALTSMLEADGFFGRLTRTESTSLPQHPLEPKPPHRTTRAKSVIFLFLVGGPSQIDTFDHKPLLQKLHGKPVPESFRDAVKATRFANVFHGCKDELMASPFTWSQHGQSGLWVSNLMPHITRHADDLCVLHSLQADSNNHAPASYQLHTGDIRPGKASLGSWVTYGLGSVNHDLPGYVTLFDAGPLGGAANYSNGFLPAAFQPTRLRDKGTPVLDLLPPPEFADGQRDSLDLIRELNLQHRDARPGFAEFDARIASYELAARMQLSVPEISDLSTEPAHVLRAYGADDPRNPIKAGFAKNCILARRLIERGVRFVQLFNGAYASGGELNWDGHNKLKEQYDRHAAILDQPAAALIRDLGQRGLLENTLVVWCTEFGRMPFFQKGAQGRDHNPDGFTCWMTGAGIRKGVSHGVTDELGRAAVKDIHPLYDFNATLLHLLGLDHERLTFEHNGVQRRLTNVEGHVIREILA